MAGNVENVGQTCKPAGRRANHDPTGTGSLYQPSGNLCFPCFTVLFAAFFLPGQPGPTRAYETIDHPRIALHRFVIHPDPSIDPNETTTTGQAISSEKRRFISRAPVLRWAYGRNGNELIIRPRDAGVRPMSVHHLGGIFLTWMLAPRGHAVRRRCRWCLCACRGIAIERS